ncbi:MAG: histidine--tRNA ligase [Bernardetiaceae bacterium]|nr:histidine--tRNA ligase [Bernardetiaceae bacterium]
MASQKPALPKGMRDFSPEQMAKRQYLFDTIQEVFKRYGYQPIETPTMEKLSTLTGKYGDEGDTLLFKVLNSGDFLKKAKHLEDYKTLTNEISEKGLRYDLTVPFARYVVQHQHEIQFPFKRYQMQPVWRADRPQRGRYREFYQCDADVVGSDSLLNEAELLMMADTVFTKLGLEVEIRLNNRKILQGLAEKIQAPEKMIALTVAIDKLDKIGWEGVSKELEEQGFTKEAIAEVYIFIQRKAEGLSFLKLFFEGNAVAHQGIAEMEEVLEPIEAFIPINNIVIDPVLARGLSYYTGCIYEIQATKHTMGSIGGGGRYDELTAIFGLKGVSGVGISFGVERIYDLLEVQGNFPEHLGQSTQVLFAVFDKDTQHFCMPIARRLRDRNIATEVYPDLQRIKKQFDYANKRDIPYVIVIGSEEMKTGKLTFKNMKTGEQQQLTEDEIISFMLETRTKKN